MLQLRTFLATAALLFAGVSLAQTDALVEGQITDLNLRSGVGTLTIREEGTNALRTFQVTENTEITVRRDPVHSRITRIVDADPADLEVGHDVLLDVRTEVDGRETLVAYERVTVEVPARTARTAPAQPAPKPDPEPVIVAYQDNETGNDDYGYGSLPATATPLPLIAVFGASALFVAGALRLRRRTRA